MPPEVGPTVGKFLDMVAANRRHVTSRYHREPRSIRFDEFRQVVRRYRPSELLPALGELAAASSPLAGSVDDILGAPPWAIAVAARESILWGNEHRDAEVDAEALRLIFNAQNSLDEGLSQDTVADFLVRTAYLQFPYQESIYEEVARSHALLVEGAAEMQTEVLNDDAWTDVLGAPLGQVVGATFFLHSAAYANRGWVDPNWLDRDDLWPIYAVWPKEVILRRLDDLSATIADLRVAYAAVPHPPAGFERYAYNPLVRRPFIRLDGGRFLAPQPRLILPTITPASLYYAGINRFDQSFSRDVGHLTEHYVGKQLRSIDPGITVHPEIAYRDGKQHLMSVDWFIDLPSTLVLVEVKSVRFGLLERAGFGDYEDDVRTLLNKSARQLERSAAAIEDGREEFAHLPQHKPRLGIIVTGEPYYLGNSPWFRDLVTTPPPFPTLTASLRDVEHLAQLELADVERQLTTSAGDPERSTWNLGVALDGDLGTRDNSVLRRGWNSYPWPKPLDAAEG